MNTMTRSICGLLLALGLLLSGCGPSRPSTADPQQCRKLLLVVLEAWKQGDTPQSLYQRSPRIHTSDPEWAAGAQLERYEVKEDGTLNGYDFNCPVRLWLRQKSGTLQQRNVRYTIGTHPQQVVVRDMGG